MNGNKKIKKVKRRHLYMLLFFFLVQPLGFTCAYSMMQKPPMSRLSEYILKKWFLLKHIVQQGVKVNSIYNNSSEKLLEIAFTTAVSNNDLQTVEYLLYLGVDVNAKDEECKTALIYAAENNNLDMVHFLVGKGADVNIKDKFNDIKDKFNDTVLFNAINIDNLEMVMYLVGKGADVNIKDNNVYIPLIRAIINNNLEMVKFLVDNGANVNVKNHEGLTPVMLAVKNNNLEMVKFLVDNGADVNSKNKTIFNYPELFYAVNNNNLEMVKYLTEHGADVNAEDYFGSRVLIQAALNDNLEMFEYLMAHGAQVDDKLLTKIIQSSVFSNLSIQLTNYREENNQKDPQALKNEIIKEENVVISPYAWFALALQPQMDKNNFWHTLYALYRTTINPEKLLYNLMYVKVPEATAYHLIHCLTDKQRKSLSQKLENGTNTQQALRMKLIDYTMHRNFIDYKSGCDLKWIILI